MLDLKKTLIKILENLQILKGRRTNYDRTTSENITLAPGASTWTTLAFPSASNGKDIRFAGYYASDKHANVYSCQMLRDGVYMAISNLGSSSITFNVTCIFSY